MHEINAHFLDLTRNNVEGSPSSAGTPLIRHLMSVRRSFYLYIGTGNHTSSKPLILLQMFLPKGVRPFAAHSHIFPAVPLYS